MLLKVIIGLIILLFTILILRPFDHIRPTNTYVKKTLLPIHQNTPSTSNTPVIFTYPIFKGEDIDWVSPLGESNGGYIEVQPLAGMTVNIKKDIAQKGPIEVYAPTDMELVAYSFTLMEPEPTPDWSLHFKINDNLELVLHHIKNANQKIVDVTGNTPKKNDSRTTEIRWPQKIKFKAGEVIGTTTGTSLANNWNIYLYDKKVKHQFVNQKRYESNHIGQRLMNAACVFDYYENPEIKESFYNLLGTTKAGEAKECGTSSKDKKGTLSGLWHLKTEGIDFGSYEGDYADPFSIYIKADKSIMIYEMAKKTFTIYPNTPTYKNPEEITDSHCYQLTDNWNQNEYKGYAFFKIESDTQMSVFYSPSGSCPATLPTSNTKTYYR